MKNHPNEDRICDVVQDLLPLYLEGDCALGSRALVEEHLKTCADCRKKYDLMRTPLAGVEGSPEPSAENMTAKRAFQKVRRRMKLVICVFLAILLAIPVGILLNREKNGDGLTLSNRGSWKLTRSLMETWQEEGAAAMVEGLEPRELYEDRTDSQSEIQVVQTYGMQGYIDYENYAPEGQGEHWVELELLGETYCISCREDWPGDAAEIPGYDKSSQELNRLYQEGRELDLLHQLLLDHSEEIVLSESAYQAVTEAFDDLDPEYFYPIERDSGSYYYYIDPENLWNPPAEINRETVLQSWMEQYALDYPADFWRVLSDLKPLDPDYLMVRQTATAVPKPLFEEYLGISEEIYQNFQAYAQYYVELGYDTFADQWRQQLTALLEEYPLELTSYQLNRIEIPDEEVHLYFYRTGFWETEWEVTLDGQPATVTFRVEENRWACLENIQFQGQEVSAELEEWSQQIQRLSQPDS